MVDTWSGAISFTGLGSGTDFDSIIEQLMEVEGYRMDQLEAWKASWEVKQEALNQLNTALITLKSTVSGFDTVNEFMTRTATSADTSALTASATAEAQEDTHNVVINQLAANDIWVNYGTAFSDPTDTVTTSNASLTFTYAGTGYTIDVDAGTSLAGLANLINADPDLDDGVRASVISDGTSYYLQLRGMDLGASNTITINASTIPGFAPGNFVQTQTAADCQVKVDGFPPGGGNWIELETNTLTDVIEGVTLNLKDTTDAGGVTLEVATDQSQVLSNVGTIISQINTVRSLIQDLTAFDEDEESGSVLTGNYGVQMVSQQLNDVLTSFGLGFLAYDATTGSGDLYSALSQVGITTDAETSSITFGLLVLDEDDFLEALQADPDGVAELFSAYYEVESRSTDMTAVSCVEEITQGGTYDVSYTASGGALTTATVNGYACSIDGDTFTVLAGAAKGLMIRADNLANGVHTGEVSVKVGKMLQLYDKLDELTDTSDGVLNIIDDNYDAIIESIDDKIDYEETRLALKEQRLTERYARLEETLIVYEGIGDTLDNLISQLDS